MRALSLIAAVSLMFSSSSLAGSPEQLPEPWAVASDTAVTSRDISFQNGGATLSGTLFYPAGTRPRATVIALHGAGVPLRSDPLYRHLIQIMPRLGMAVFLYDRRGSGRSTMAVQSRATSTCWPTMPSPPSRGCPENLASIPRVSASGDCRRADG
ncbi:alpha/beta hydrolase family protein [Sphingomonas mollis]|uniref:alpha/beta hydrolase family protein n=1 Tax=Sphingomonas mollis TaxID=2795726 RepID=UPI001E441EB5|nr:alpha/beta hydrolase [Sphingomonas sp. BT553]